MNEEFKEFAETPAPTLTLDPFGTAETKASPIQTEEPQKPAFDESILSPEEKKMVEDFASQIDLTNSNMILQYGVGAQKKMADFSETALENVRTKDLGDIGEMLTSVVSELKSFEAEEEDKGFLGFFKKNTNKLTNMKAKYDKAEVNVNRICHALEGHQVQLMKDIAMLDKMYQLNLTYFKELSMYILAGKKKLAKVREEDLKEMREKAARTGLPEDAQAVQDLDGLCNRFEKKLYDLELTRQISLQTAPQIRLVQGNDTTMVEKIQSTIVNTIPLWKSQMVMALTLHHSQQAMEAQREVNDVTNRLLQSNAEKLHQGSVEIAREAERGIVDIETLQKTNQELISTLEEVRQIQADGAAKRAEAEVELGRIEGELKQKLLELRG